MMQYFMRENILIFNTYSNILLTELEAVVGFLEIMFEKNYVPKEDLLCTS